MAKVRIISTGDSTDILSREKKDAKKAARQLRYSSDVIERIDKATSSCEIDRIMKTAREGKI